MSIYKYVTGAGLLRFLSSWSLRITPADQFNDPFETRPALTAITPDSARQMLPRMVEPEIARQVADGFEKTFLSGTPEGDLLIVGLVRYLLREATPDEERDLLATIQKLSGKDPSAELHSVRASLDEKLSGLPQIVDSQLPVWNRALETILHTKLPEVIGVLCLTGSGRSPLMWAHYADSHCGALLEFDERHPAFNRRRHSEDEFGFLRRVWYSDTRPHMTLESFDDAMVELAQTKALEWAYEQEMRLLWPLTMADQTLQAGAGKIHLIDVPAPALRSVTMGCKAPQDFVEKVKNVLAANAAASHVQLLQAEIDRLAFALNYREIQPR